MVFPNITKLKQKTYIEFQQARIDRLRVELIKMENPPPHEVGDLSSTEFQQSLDIIPYLYHHIFIPNPF